MKSTTLKALRGSIAHWRRLATNKRRRGERPAGSQCDLCKLFHPANNPSLPSSAVACKGCPVAKKTGGQCCLGTPFDKAAVLFNRSKSKQSKKFLLAARKELDFLKSLLPRKERGK